MVFVLTYFVFVIRVRVSCLVPYHLAFELNLSFGFYLLAFEL